MKSLIIIVHLLFLVFSSCKDTAEPVNREMGSFTLKFSSPSRTILPITPSLNDFTHLELELKATNGGTDKSVIIENYNGSPELQSIALAPGTYTLTVDAYKGPGKTNIAARGTAAGIIILPGTDTPRTITLRALLFEDGATGTFSWNITVPDYVEQSSAYLSISPLDAVKGTPTQNIPLNLSENPLNPSQLITSGSRNLNSGLYNAAVYLKKTNGYEELVWRELLHVYSALNSNFQKVFSDEHFNKTHYIITFNYNDGRDDGEVSVLHSETITKPADPTQAGHVFFGWYTDNGSFQDKWDFNEEVYNDLTLHAMWLIGQYFDVNLDISDDGPVLEIDDEQVTADTGIIIYRDVNDGTDTVTIKVKNASDYDTGSIKWWYKDIELGTGDELTLDSSDVRYNDLGFKLLMIEAEIDGVRYVTPVIFRVTKIFTATFFPDNGDPVFTLEIEHGGKITEPTDENWTGTKESIPAAGLYRGEPSADFILDGWFLGTQLWNFSTDIVYGDIILTAGWKPSNIIDISARTGNNNVEKAMNYIRVFPLTADPNYYTLLLDEDVSVTPQSWSTANVRLVIEGLSKERVIQYAGPAGSSLFSIGSSTASLTIGDNITLKGLSNSSGSLVNVSTGRFILKGSSKITGHSVNNNGFGAVNITNSGIFEMQGGEIIGNTPADIFVSSSTNINALTLSGNARIGVLTLNATSTAAFARVTLDGWTGNTILNLHGSALTAPSINTVIDWWLNKRVIEGTATEPLTKQSVESFALGNFLSSAATNNIQPVQDHLIADETRNGINMGSLVLGYAQQPNITVQPQGRDYLLNSSESVAALSITAASADQGVISRQWYSNSTPGTIGATAISGATAATYTPVVAELGTTYYYCVVTNTNNNAFKDTTAYRISNFTGITVLDDTHAKVFMNDIPFLNLNAAFNSMNTSVTVYDIRILSNQTLAARTLSGAGRSITLRADDPLNNPAEIQLTGNGSLFTVGTTTTNSGTLTLGNGITLKGHVNNTAPLVSVISGGTFNMLEGSVITGNRNNATSGSFGGGVRNAGRFNMIDGEISGNTVTGGDNDGGGVFVLATGITALGGTAKIINNIKETIAGNYTNNLYLASGRTITLDTANVPSSGMNVGITIANSILDTVIANNAFSDYENYFFADNSILGVNYQENSLILGINNIYDPANVVVVDMYSTSTAGWNSARLRIIVNVSELNDTITVPSNNSRTMYYFIAEPGSSVQLFWTKGSNDNPCAFIVYYADTSPIPSSTQSTWSTSNALLFRMNNSLGNVNNGNLLGNFTR